MASIVASPVQNILGRAAGGVPGDMVNVIANRMRIP